MLLPYEADTLTVRDREKIASLTSDTMRKVGNAYRVIRQADMDLYFLLMNCLDKQSKEYGEAKDIIHSIENAINVLEVAFIGYLLLTGDRDSEIMREFSEENRHGADAAKCEELLKQLKWRGKYHSKESEEIVNDVLDKTDAEALPILEAYIADKKRRE